MLKLRQIILVLGMHRSGTSALADLISRLGFDLGKNLLPANEYNANGYYENERLVRFHEEALAHLGSSWHDLRFLPENAFESPWLDDAAQQLSSILNEEFGEAERIVVKDPRACRLLPIWHQLARERDIDLRFVLIGRHPLEVAYSLAHRDGFSRQKSFLLWLQYNLIADRETRSERRLILRYRDLLADPAAKARELAALFEVEAGADKIASAAESIEASHVHHAATSEISSSHPDIRRWTEDVWQSLFGGKAQEAGARKKLDRIGEEIRERLSLLPVEANGQGDFEAGKLKRTLASLKERHEEKNQTLQNVIRQRDEVRKRVETVENEAKSLKDRYFERDQLLQAVMLHRDEARRQVEAAAKREAILRGEARQQAEAAAAKEAILRDKVTAQLQSMTNEQQVRESRWSKLESDLRRELAFFEEERAALVDSADRTADRIAQRETEDALRGRELETIRRGWKALLVRQGLKKLKSPFSDSPPELISLNGLKPSVWNHSAAGFRFGAAIFPDLNVPGGFFLEGWILRDNKKNTRLSLRLVSETGQRGEEKADRPRLDIPILFPDHPRAAKSGFSFSDIAKFDGAKCRLEAKKGTGEWVPLALVDFSGVGADHFREIHEIGAAQLFDAAWYAKRYRLKDYQRIGLISHYLREGAARGFFPNPLFDGPFYTRAYPEICATGENPLLSYLRSAKAGEARPPNEFFDPAWYFKRYKDASATGLEPLAHYLRFGKLEGRNPGPRFDANAYLKANPDVAQSPLDALTHYLHYGSSEKRSAPKPEDAVKWIYEADTPPDEAKVNILLVGHVLGERVFGGERSLLELIQMIDRDRFNVYCTFPQAGGSILETIKPYLAGVAVFPYEWWRGDEAQTDGYDRKFETLMQERRIGLVHVNSIVLRDPLVAAKRLGIPSVLHLREIIAHDPHLAERIGLPADEITAQVNQRGDFFIANSHFTQRQQGEQDRSFVLYNTADETALDLPFRESNGLLRVAMLSSNLPKKGLDDFFLIARRAQERKDRIEFWLVGPENQWTLEHFQKSGGCPANVRLTGYVDDPPEALRQVDAIINLSNFAESFGRSVAEGMLARRPAVVYEHGALPELIRDGIDGFVVPFRDTDEALERLNRLACDRALLEQMGESARTRAVEHFSRAVGAQNLNRIYDTILQSAPQKRLQAAARMTTARKMRIGYFMWHFPVPSETFVLNELRDFVRLGHDVLVFCKESPHKEFEPDFPIEWQQVKSPEELAAKMKESEREIMHSHFVFPTVTKFLWPACEIAGIPFTFIAHAVDIFRHENAAQNRLGEVARSPLCRRVFAPGTFHRDFFIESGVPEEKIIINPQGILFDAYEAQPIAPRLEQPRMSVCAIHRFIEKKGLDDAIRAAKELARHGISLHLYGYGPLEKAYRDLAAELGLENVFFPGPVKDRDHMISVFREHDLFLCPAVRAADGDMDGIPTILIEAMASHVPVVASRVSSIPDLVIDGVTGYLCEPNNVDSLTQSILRFYREPAAQVQAMIENARKHVRKNFDVMKSNRTLVRTWSNEGLDVILVTFNATAEVREVIDRLYRFTRTPFQLYLVDNGSEPETLEYLRSVEAAHENARLLPQEQNLFVGPGTNKGMEAGRAPVAVYLCSREGYVLAEGWDQTVLDYMDDHPAVGLAGTLGYSPSYFTGADYLEQLEPFPRFRNREFAAQNRERRFRHVQGGLFALRRAMFEEIGGFSEAVPHNHTDVEYSYYVESCGWQIGQIPDLVVIYQKSRPLLTSRLAEWTCAVHPGSLTLAPVLDAVVRRETNFCNACGQAVSLGENLVCPVCGSTPFQRSLYRHLAESTLTYRQLVALHISESDWLLPDWKKMFSGRTITYEALTSEMKEKGRIDHPDNRFDLIVLRLPDAVPPSPDLLREIVRLLAREGSLLYFQNYGTGSILDAAEFFNPKQIAAMLESHGLTVQNRVRFASGVVRYSEREIFVCRQTLSA